MKTKVTLESNGRRTSFVANGRPSDVSDRIVKIKRAYKIILIHGVSAI